MVQKTEYSKKEKFIARDVSWLSFNERVLKEAEDPRNPLIERLRFLGIFVSNLDEFFMVRVAGIKNLIYSGINKRDRFGYYPQELLEEVRTRTRELMAQLYRIYQGRITKDLEGEGISIRRYKDLRGDQKRFVKNYFADTLYPIITPLAVDPGHPFPVLPSRTLAIAVLIKRKNIDHLAVVPIPKNVPRVLRLPSRQSQFQFIMTDEIICENLAVFFKGYRVKDKAFFRVIRDSELDLEEELTPNLLKMMEGEVKKRNVAKIVHLEIEESCTSFLAEMLTNGLMFPMEEVVRVPGHLDLTFLFVMASLIDKPELFYDGFVPGKMEYENIFDEIKEGDFILHVPYQAFDPTVDLIEAAARDEHVLAIKMTLYRTNSDSAIIEALKEAAANKKQVTILVEIKARFDEENNIRWARELEEFGCHVIYGIPGLKVHSKMILIVREEEGSIQRYVHLSTGNYNENTARVYTDVGYFTCNEDFAKDISDVFNVVTGYSMPPAWQRIISAPHDLRDYLITLINREIKFQQKSKNGSITAKFNSLEDTRIIEKLYEASQAGVKIDLIVRGICCLIPGIKGLSENIRVRSIVGRFLEHTRIFVFNNNGSPRVFLSSADWMRRNFDRRIELMFEIYKNEIKDHLKEIMDSAWQDNTKSWALKSDRLYEKFADKKEAFNFQEYLIKFYVKHPNGA